MIKKNLFKRYLSPITSHLNQRMNIRVSPNLGFTLIEFLVVATLLIVITSIGMIGYSATSKNARDKQREKDIQIVRLALEQYYEIYEEYPSASSMDDLLNDAQFTEFLQDNSVIDPINDGIYEYMVSSNTTTYQIGYTRERDQVQVVVNNLGN